MTALSHTELTDWHSVRDWCDEHIQFDASYVDLINSGLYPKDAFSMGQIASKAWMINQLSVLTLPKPSVIAILGCWIGSAVPKLAKFSPDRIYGIDQDAHSIELSEQFNQRMVQNNWQYKGVVADVNSINISDMQFETGGELITVTPDWVINTSCEHMSEDWFHSVQSDQLVIMQTNNSTQFDGHINVCHSVQHMQQQYALSTTLYAGSFSMPSYSRYMQIGYR